MKALINDRRNNADNMGGKKEVVATITVVSRVPAIGPDLREVCEARFYMARRSDGASPVYCSLWVHGQHWTSGRGKASGYGYHKQSAALQSAIESAGIVLIGDPYGREQTEKPARIDGVGDSAMREAMRAIAIAAGADPDLIHISY